MARKGILAVLALALSIASPQAHAGNWAVFSIDSWPEPVVAGQPFVLQMRTRQHGIHLTSEAYFAPQPVFTDVRNDRVVNVVMRAMTETGRYSATVLLPSAGVWRLRIMPFEQPMPDLNVYAKRPVHQRLSARAQQAALIAHGQQLFEAKGCAACHAHQRIADSGRFANGYGVDGAPDLNLRKFDAAYLKIWLADPTKTKPTAKMPNLLLAPAEIDALSAFLLANQPK
jgi:mono/diheme cytochrome c family protein